MTGMGRCASRRCCRRAHSYERVFSRVGIACSLTDLRESRHHAARDALAEPRLERAIGVIYRPDTEFHSHYFEALLSQQFDAYLWFEKTRAITPLPSTRPHGVPETYPFGV